MRIDRQHACGGDAERIAIRRRLGDGADADVAACSGPVLDHDG